MDQNHLAIDKLGNPDLILDGDEDNDMFDSEPEIAASHSFSNVPISVGKTFAQKVGKNSKIKSMGY